MREEILDVLQQECPWTFGRDDPRDVEKERALRFISEAVSTAKRVLL